MLFSSKLSSITTKDFVEHSSRKLWRQKFYFRVFSGRSWKNFSWQKYFLELRHLGNIIVLIQIKFRCTCILSFFSKEHVFLAHYTFYHINKAKNLKELFILFLTAWKSGNKRSQELAIKDLKQMKAGRKGW